MYLDFVFLFEVVSLRVKDLALQHSLELYVIYLTYRDGFLEE